MDTTRLVRSCRARQARRAPQVFDGCRATRQRNATRCGPSGPLLTGTAGCGTARPVVWEGGERKLAPYPMGAVSRAVPLAVYGAAGAASGAASVMLVCKVLCRA